MKFAKEIIVLVFGLGLIAAVAALWLEVRGAKSEPAETGQLAQAGPPSPSLKFNLPFDAEKDRVALMKLASEGRCLAMCLAIDGKAAGCASAELDGALLCKQPPEEAPPPAKKPKGKKR
jgi:hypothetical protein